MFFLSRFRLFLISILCFFHKKVFFKKLKIFDVEFELLLNLNNGYIDKEFLLFGVYEKEIFLLIKSLSSKNKNFLDVWSNIGQYSNFCPPLFNKVFAFEPIKRIYEQNKKSLIKNSFYNVSLFNLALWSENSNWFIYENFSNVWSSSIYNSINSGKDICEPIDIVTGDSVLLDRIDLIKIDVEGYELNVLKGCKNIISKYHPDLILEFSVDFYNKIDSNIASNIVSFLVSFDYEFYIIKKDKIEKTDSSSLLALKRENVFCTISRNISF